MPCTNPEFDGAWFNFRIFLKFGAPTCLGPGQVASPAPPSLLAALVFIHRKPSATIGDFCLVAIIKHRIGEQENWETKEPRNYRKPGILL